MMMLRKNRVQRVADAKKDSKKKRSVFLIAGAIAISTLFGCGTKSAPEPQAAPSIDQFRVKTPCGEKTIFIGNFESDENADRSEENLNLLLKTYPKHFSKLEYLGKDRFEVILNDLVNDDEYRNFFFSQPDLFVQIATSFTAESRNIGYFTGENKHIEYDPVFWVGQEFLQDISTSEAFDACKTYPEHVSQLASLGEKIFGSLLDGLTGDKKLRDLFINEPDLFVLIATEFRGVPHDNSEFASRGEELLNLMCSMNMVDLVKTYPKQISQLASLGEKKFEAYLVGLDNDAEFRALFESQPDLFVLVATMYREDDKRDMENQSLGETFLSIISNVEFARNMFKVYPKHFSSLASKGEVVFSGFLSLLDEKEFSEKFQKDKDFRDNFVSNPFPILSE